GTPRTLSPLAPPKASLAPTMGGNLALRGGRLAIRGGAPLGRLTISSHTLDYLISYLWQLHKIPLGTRKG
ncbi:MAG: hypothetical protein QME16_02830, partial [Planctomycetota bacterium]|nr:hypothetical protein [Planctomycetota bacterium]